LTPRDIRILWSKFRRIDCDGSGNIHIVEMLTFFDLERNKVRYLERMRERETDRDREREREKEKEKERRR
jgi:hypothetical protein